MSQQQIKYKKLFKRVHEKNPAWMKERSTFQHKIHITTQILLFFRWVVYMVYSEVYTSKVVKIKKEIKNTFKVTFLYIILSKVSFMIHPNLFVS